ncbi:MAG: YbjN domain-containing protein [Alphaproteobacteria bacterium]|nr:YbjN domain-containing protein [Alphaproteobacteria bacterium]MBU0796500.1 YbjN domain-containing protein [Alphaproteobacteria bacterium]MBU0888086.1 YbjN domain-containing protein [Alphaproteobacteria bacterium]MBU1811531.1 YbjN domain-containing protein [Alphaproteobacteria bacterium]MBU2091593.1 YbjN domain-containing protein [Alphaproteobacteria bacterium]
MLDIETHSETAVINPLDLVEELVEANEWAFDRSRDDELAVEITGRWCDYHLFFVWREDMSALHFSCVFDTKVQPAKRTEANALLALANERLWLGHFDLSSEDGMPMFRHTVPLRGARGATVEQIEDLVDVAVTECERFYPAFQFVLWGGKTAVEALDAAMLDTVGEA